MAKHEKTHSAFIRLPVPLWRELQKSAERHDRNATQEVTAMIRRCLESGDEWQVGRFAGRKK